MPKVIKISAIPFLCILLCCTSGSSLALEKFTLVSRGLEYGVFFSSQSGGGRIHVLRVDPRQANLGLVLASQRQVENRTVSEWCRHYRMAAAINAGMFLKDYKTNVGYLRNGEYVQNRRWNRKYMSALAFRPRVPGIAPAVMIDLDSKDAMKILGGYNCVVQNLRLMKADQVNVWGKSEKRWSESAIGMDREERVLFIFSRYPLAMWQFNEAVKSLGLGVTRMMHLEGGPMASLSINTRELKLDLAGSYETDTRPDESNSLQWPVPNIIGVLEN